AGSELVCSEYRAESWLQRFHSFHGPTGPDVIQMDVALIERPVGDRYINTDLWDLADEQVLEADHKGLLRENGLRVAQVDGIPPAGLQSLLTSESSCANPRRIRMRAGNTRTLLLGPSPPQCRFQIKQALGEPAIVTLEQAQCTLLVVPTKTNDGHVRLQFTPQILHGETTLRPRPDPSGSRWVLEE